MSTKIYNGLLIERAVTLAELRGVTLDLRPKLDAMVEEAQLLALARVAASAFDRAWLGRRREEGPETERPLAEGQEWLTGTRGRDQRGESSGVPMGFEAVFYGISARKTLAVPFGDRKLRAAFAEAFGAREYGYWDNSDNDGVCSAKEWSRRGRNWEKALGGASSFDEAGMVAKMVSGKYSQWWFPTPEALDEALGSREEFAPRARAERLADEICRDRFVVGFLAKREDPKRARSGASEVVAALESWREEAKSANAVQVEDTAALLAAGLKKLGVEDLRTPFEEIEKAGAHLKAALEDRAELEAAGVVRKPAARAKRGL